MAISELHLLVRRCLHRRVSPQDFSQIITQYRLQSSLSSTALVAAFISAALNFCLENDPLLPQYQQVLVLTNLIDLNDILVGLIESWRAYQKRNEALSKLIAVETALISNLGFIDLLEEKKAQRCITLCARWLQALAQSPVTEKTPNVVNLIESVALLLASLLNHPTAMASRQIYDEVQTALDRCLTPFPSIAMQLMNKLSTIPKTNAGNEDATSPNTMNIAAYQYEANIHDMQVMPTRSAITAYLNVLLRTGATIDDTSLFSFLSARFQANHAIIFNELISSTMEAYIRSPDSTNEMYQAQCQLFILDKLPSILAFVVTSGFDGFSSEAVLVDSWNFLNSANSDTISTWKRFLQICSLYDLITAETLNTITGEDSSSKLKGFYAKDEIVNQVTANHSRGPRLMEELLKKDGSGSNFSQAIMEIMHEYCLSKDTQHLKDMANAIVRKPSAINAIALHIKPSIFLQPLCTLLDEWRWDEIHGESQPVYDEFGSVLLLILSFKLRLDLKDSDIGIQKSDGFLVKYLASGHSEQELAKLSESSQKHLGAWIQSLYIDEGISDELTTNCSAHDFYLLVPTLIRQSVLARAKGKLSNDTLRAGLEYLLEPFLLPSLLSVFGWVERIAEIEPKTALQIIQIFTKQHTGTEAPEIHQTIIDMAANCMELAGLDVNENFSSHIKAMKKSDFSLSTSLSRGARASKELNNLNQLSSMVAQAATQDGPYIADTLNSVLLGCGPTEVMQTLLNLLIQFSGTADFHHLHDFEATITSTNPYLRHVISLIHSRLPTFLVKGDTLKAEAIVHLYRRVGLYHTALVARELGMDHSFVPMAGLSVANLNLDAVPATNFDQPDPNNAEDIDQVLNETMALGGLDSVNDSTFNDFDFQTDDLGLENLDDLDLDMFST